ncbi:MAG: CCA tRNA nucleotidyltransferase [Nanoarchaeota archaeon]|nr:MAG: CCA tRNA nucleotidyltransferase [Nanoarchaeota archaeon]
MGRKNKKTDSMILEEARSRLVPTKEELAQTNNKVSEILSKINSVVRPANAIVGGSGAKNTFLRGQYDIDMFVLYPYEKYKERSAELSDMTESKLKKVFSKFERIHGSRDYFRLNHKDMQFEIIPILKISKASQAVNITDISPLHSSWVKRKANKNLQNDIRLTKAFCKGAGVYGAESYIRGFSGYVCEILTIHYGSFTNFLKGTQKWIPGDVIDTEKQLKGKPAFTILNKSKLQSPLIVIDPVQRGRNAAAALDNEALYKLKKKAAQFQKKPSIEYFSRTYMTTEQIAKKFKGATIIKVQPIEGKEDVAGSALYKVFRFLEAEAEKNGFNLKESDWEWDKKNDAIFWFVPSKEPLPETYIHPGPSLKFEKHAQNFKKMYKKTILKRKKLYAIIPRKHRTLKSLFNELIKKDQLLKQKARNYSLE